MKTLRIGSEMPSGGKTKHDLAYFTDNPWNGESDDFEQWQKVLALRGLDLGGPLMRAWVLGEGPTLEPATGRPLACLISTLLLVTFQTVLCCR